MELKLIVFAVFVLMASILPIRYTLSIAAACFAAWLYYAWWRVNFYVPEGYTPESARQLRNFLAFSESTVKLAKLAAVFGLGTFVGNHRRLSRLMLPDTEAEQIQGSDYVFNGVKVRIYENTRDRRYLRPALVWYHGGGWVFGSIDEAAVITKLLCKKANVVVVSVEYRLAPEHRFPAAIDDCVAATRYFINNALQFNVEPTRVGVGGDSAGGNLAAAVCLRLRDIAFQPPIRLQLLVYPVVQALNFQVPSMLSNADGPLFRSRTMAFCTLSYLDGVDNYSDNRITTLLRNGHVVPDIKKTASPYVDVAKLPARYLANYDADDGSATIPDEAVWHKLKYSLLNPYFSPIMAESFERLPQAYVITVEHDPLRDDGLMYVERLRESGVDVVHYHSDIGIHGIVSMTGIIEEADGIFDQMVDYVRNRL